MLLKFVPYLYANAVRETFYRTESFLTMDVTDTRTSLTLRYTLGYTSSYMCG